MTTRILLALALVAVVAPAADAQPAAPRGLITINAGLQSPSRTFSDSFTFENYVEDARARADYEVQPAPFFDGGFAVRLFGPIGAGVAFSRFSHSGTATVSGTIPHPFFFDRDRAIAGDVTGVKRNETAVHAQLVAFVPAGNRVLVVLSAGPSFFTVEQSLVSGVTYDESYPFDEASFRSATVRLERQQKIGFNAGADVTVKLGGSFGVGGMIRYTATTVDFTIDDRTLSLEAGGLQAGGGIRFVF
jgi:hypothetical protein